MSHKIIIHVSDDNEGSVVVEKDGFAAIRRFTFSDESLLDDATIAAVHSATAQLQGAIANPPAVNVKQTKAPKQAVAKKATPKPQTDTEQLSLFSNL
jgi:hypothetical protein